MQHILEFSEVGKTFQGPDCAVNAIRNVSLVVDKGEMVAVQGPSGCGKTTLLLTGGALLRPSSGRVTIDGEEIYAMSSALRGTLRAKKLGFVFQQFHLLPYLSVRDNVLAPSVAMPSQGASDRASELLARFNLTERSEHVPAQLSTGERQRVALARALLNNPTILLADEPTGNLDADNADIILSYMSHFVSSGGAVLIVTHDQRAVKSASRVIHMKDGVLIDCAREDYD